MSWNNGRNGVLVDDLLFSITVQDYGEGIEGRNGSLHLVAIHQKHGDGLPLPAELGQQNFLQVVFLQTAKQFV